MNARHMHVVTPGTGFEPIGYRLEEDYAAYFRLLDRDLERFMHALSRACDSMTAVSR
jgi:hypothetical protein